MTDILLIQPPAYGIFMPPLGLASLSAFLRRDGLSVRVVDYNILFYHSARGKFAELWRFNRNETQWTREDSYRRVIQPDFQAFSKRVIRDILQADTHLVGISVLDTGVFATMDLIRTIREHFGESIGIVLGGPSMGTHFSEKFLREFGVLATFEGEGEVGLRDFVRARKRGEVPDPRAIEGATFLEKGVVQSGSKAKIGNLNDLPFPDFSDFDLDSYAFSEKVLPLSTSRGCVARCTFCSEAVFMGRYRDLAPKRVADELQNHVEKYGVRIFRFNDSLINGNLKMLEGWLDEWIARKIPITFGGAQALINSRMSEEIMKKLKLAGCELIQYGVETGSDRILKFMKKGVSSKDAYEVIRRTHGAGISVQINIIVGHYRETLWDYLQTLYFVFRVRKYVSYINLNCFNFTEPTQDFDRAPGIVNKPIETWRTRSGLNNYTIRRMRRTGVLLLMRGAGIRET